MSSNNQRKIFKIHQLQAQKNPKKFECIATDRSRALVGTADGIVLVYEVKQQGVTPSTPSAPIPRQVSNAVYVGSCVQIVMASRTKKPITQIGVLAELGVLIVLSDRQVSTFRYNPVSRPTGSSSSMSPSDGSVIVNDSQNILHAVKGALLFTVKKQGRKYWLAVMAMQRVFVLSWHDTAQSFDLYKDYDLPLPDAVQTATWSGKNLILGFRKEYVLLNTATSRTTPLFPPGKSRPIASNVEGMGECFVGIHDDLPLGVRLNFEGKPTSKHGVRWGGPPAAINYHHPYFAGLTDRNTIEFHCLWRPQGAANQSTTLCQTLQLKHVEKISSPSFVDYDQPRLNERTVNPQPREMLIVSTEDSFLYYLEMQPMTEQITALAERKQFDEAGELCKVCVNDLTPEMQSNLLIQQGDYFFSQMKFPDALGKFTEAGSDPRQVISYFPNYLPKVVEERWKSPIENQFRGPLGDQYQTALTQMINYIMPKRKPQGGSGTTSSVIIQQQSFFESTAATDETFMLCAVDSAILRSYIELQQFNAAAEFIQKPNWCVAEDCEQLFITNHDFVSLTILYQVMGEHRKALQMLKSIGIKGEYDSSNADDNPDGFSVAPFLDRVLKVEPHIAPANQHKGAIVKLVERYIQEGEDAVRLSIALQGVFSTVVYIQRLPPDQQPIIYEYSKWVLQCFPPDFTVRMFSEAEQPIRPLNVITFLEALSAEAESVYIEQILKDDVNATPDAEIHTHRATSLIRALDTTKNKSDSHRAALVAKLNDFLTSSLYFNAEKALSVVLNSPSAKTLTNEKALIYFQLQQHDAAITMYMEAGNFKDAERYAQKVVSSPNSDSKMKSSVYRQLLLAHLNPKGSDARSTAEALALIKRNPEMDAAAALSVLPDDIKVSDIYEFFRGSLALNSSQTRTRALEIGILQSHLRELIAKKTVEHRRSTIIDQDTRCAICGRKMFASVFVRFPNGDVVHQACLKEGREHILPNTLEDCRRNIDIL